MGKVRFLVAGVTNDDRAEVLAGRNDESKEAKDAVRGEGRDCKA